GSGTMYKRHIALASLLVWAAQCSLSVYGALPSVTVAATDPNATIGTTDPGVLTFSRTTGTATNLVVNFALGGTAVKWTDYRRIPEGDMPVSVTIPAGSASTTLAIYGFDNTTLANPETVSFTVSPDSA